MIVKFQWIKYTFSFESEVTLERYLYAKNYPDRFSNEIVQKIKEESKEALIKCGTYSAVLALVGFIASLLILLTLPERFGWFLTVFLVIAVMAFIFSMVSYSNYAIRKYSLMRSIHERAQLYDSFELFYMDPVLRHPNLGAKSGFLNFWSRAREFGAYKDSKESN